MYELAFSQLEVSPRDAIVVGDSVQKDLAPAMAMGATGVWARYGTEFERRNFDTLLSLTMWSASGPRGV